VPDSLEMKPDAPLTPQEQAIADSLTIEFVSRLDAALLPHAHRSPRKVAMIVGLTMQDPSLRVAGLPDVFYAQRVTALVQEGLLCAWRRLRLHALQRGKSSVIAEVTPNTSCRHRSVRSGFTVRRR
jgi:hypothetical protein